MLRFNLALSLAAGLALAALGRALGGRVLGRIFYEPVVTLERVRLCTRGGVHLADPLHVAERDDAGLPVWQKIMVHSSQLAKAE